MGKGFEDSLATLASGFAVTLEVSMWVAFVTMFFFVMNLGFKVKQQVPGTEAKKEIFWGMFSSVSSFLLVSVFLFLIHSPLMANSADQSAIWGLTFIEALTLSGMVGWLLLIGYLFLPVRQRDIKNVEDEDDISSVPFVGVFLGYCLAVFVYGAYEWPQDVMSLTFGMDDMGQAAFYGFLFVLPVALVWGVLGVAFYLFAKALFEHFIPHYVPVVLLAVAFIYQLIFQYL